MKKLSINKRTYPFRTKTKIVSARVPVSLIKKLDSFCKATGRSRSDLITKILSQTLDAYNDIELNEIKDFNSLDQNNKTLDKLKK